MSLSLSTTAYPAGSAAFLRPTVAAGAAAAVADVAAVTRKVQEVSVAFERLKGALLSSTVGDTDILSHGTALLTTAGTLADMRATGITRQLVDELAAGIDRERAEELRARQQKATATGGVAEPVPARVGFDTVVAAMSWPLMEAQGQFPPPADSFDLEMPAAEPDRLPGPADAPVHALFRPRTDAAAVRLGYGQGLELRLRGASRPHRVLFDEGARFTIGASDRAGFHLPAAAGGIRRLFGGSVVGDHHVLVEYHDGRYTVRTFVGMGRTELNGSPLMAGTPHGLRDGDVLVVGPHEITFLIPDPPLLEYLRDRIVGLPITRSDLATALISDAPDEFDLLDLFFSETPGADGTRVRFFDIPEFGGLRHFVYRLLSRYDRIIQADPERQLSAPHPAIARRFEELWARRFPYGGMTEQDLLRFFEEVVAGVRGQENPEGLVGYLRGLMLEGIGEEADVIRRMFTGQQTVDPTLLTDDFGIRKKVEEFAAAAQPGST